MDILASLNQQLIRDEGHRNLMSLSELQDRMKGWLESEYEAALFSLPGTDSIAYALWAIYPEHIYLRQFFVTPEHRRLGVGRAAFQQLNEHIWPPGTRLRLEVLSENVRAMNFWRAVGLQNYALVLERDREATT